MRFGLLSGVLWGLDTVILGIGLAMSPYIGSAEALAFASIAASFLHDAFCAGWLFMYMAAKRRLGETWRALRTRSGVVVVAGALLGGPIGMSGYVIAIANLGAAYTAIISAFYPAFGALLSYLILKEHMGKGQMVALFFGLLGVMGMGLLSAGDSQVVNAPLGLLGAAMTVVGWGSEAVLCAWGMKDDSVDNETALQIRETTSALVYGIAALPAMGGWAFTIEAAPSFATCFIALAGLTGAVSYLSYYKGISDIGASRAMALNISYSAWSVLFGFLLLGSVPSFATVVCCVVILVGTILSACDWSELFGRA